MQYLVKREPSGAHHRASRLPEAADMLGSESMWQWGLRVLRSPASGVGVVAYLACALIAVGSEVPHDPAEQSSAAHDAGNSPQTVPTAVRVVTPRLPPAESTDEGAPPAAQIDPQFFAVLQSVIDGIDGQVVDEQAWQLRQEIRETTPITDQVIAPFSDTSTPAAETVAPPLEPGVIPAGPPVAAPPSNASVPLPEAIAPAPEAVVAPVGPTPEPVGQQPVGQQPMGPLPGPAG